MLNNLHLFRNSLLFYLINLPFAPILMKKDYQYFVLHFSEPVVVFNSVNNVLIYIKKLQFIYYYFKRLFLKFHALLNTYY